MYRVVAFIRLSRLYFLPLPMLTYAIGVAMAERLHVDLDAQLLVFGLVIQLLVQLSVAYVNDYWDIPTDRINMNRTLLTGGSGELSTGTLAPGIALVAAAVCQLGAVVLAVGVGLPGTAWLLLGAALGLAIFYTTPPLKLAWRGWGELTTAAVGAVLVPQWAYSLQTGRISSDLLLISLPLVPLIMSVFVMIAVPDYEADRQVGKRTLPVRLGEAPVRWLYLTLVAGGYAGSALLWRAHVPSATMLSAFLGLPLAVWAARRLRLHAPMARVSVLLIVLGAGMPPLIAVLALNWGLRVL